MVLPTGKEVTTLLPSARKLGFMLFDRGVVTLLKVGRHGGQYLATVHCGEAGLLVPAE
jgi:hypothetical protein